MRWWITLALLALLATAGCGGGGADPADGAPNSPPDASSDRPPPEQADPLATDNTLCFGEKRKAAIPETLTVGDAQATRRGYLLELPAGTAERLTLGVLANTENATDATLANVDRFVAAFGEAEVDAIVVAGDVGASQQDIEAVLTHLAAANVPVLALIGNREGRVDFEKAVTAVAATHPHVLNFNRLRRVDTPAADLISLPGYNDRNFVHTSDGCVYDHSELGFLAEVIGEADSPVVLVSHAAHKMEGADAVDHALDTGNIGNPDLLQTVTDLKVRFGIYANAQEAGGKGTDATGARVVPPGKLTSELFVNPGPAMADPWTMNDRSTSRGMAMVMRIAGGKASYEVIRAE